MEASESAQTSSRDFLYVVFKRKFQILLFFLIVVSTVAVGTFMKKPVYEASSQILVKIGRENIYAPPAGNINPIINFNREEQINTEIEILKGYALAEQVVLSLGPNVIYHNPNAENRGNQPSVEETAQRLQKSLTTEGIKKSNVIDVRFKHANPEMAATVVNKFIHLYLDHHLDIHKTSESYLFLQDQTQTLQNKLRTAEDKLEAFKKKHQVSSVKEERSLLLGKEADLRAAFNQTISQVAETQKRIQQLQHQIADTPKTISQGRSIEQSPFAVNTLQARLVELELKEKALLTKYTEQSRLVQNARNEIRIVRQKLKEQESKRYDTVRSGVNTTYQHLQEELYKNQADLKAFKAKGDVQQTQLAEYRKNLEKLNRIEVELNQLQQEVDVDRQSYKLYLTKFEESRISNAMDTEKITNVSQIQPARTPFKPISPKKFLNMALAVFLGVFGGLGLAFFLEYLDDGLEKPEDAEKALNLPVLASIPELNG